MRKLWDNIVAFFIGARWHRVPGDGFAPGQLPDGHYDVRDSERGGVAYHAAWLRGGFWFQRDGRTPMFFRPLYYRAASRPW